MPVFFPPIFLVSESEQNLILSHRIFSLSRPSLTNQASPGVPIWAELINMNETKKVLSAQNSNEKSKWSRRGRGLILFRA